MKKEFIGIDISKSKLDVSVLGDRSHRVFANDGKGFARMLEWVGKLCGKTRPVFCIEHTGKYDVHLSLFFEEHGLDYYKVSGLAVKRSCGLKRGKNDKVDSLDLAKYASRFQDGLQYYRMAGSTLIEIKQLMAHRAKLVRQRAAHKASLSENKKVLKELASDMVAAGSREIVALMTQQIKAVEKRMKQSIGSDPRLEQNHRLLTGIKGVGDIVAITCLCLKYVDRLRLDNSNQKWQI